MKETITKIIMSAILLVIALVVPFEKEWIQKGIYIVSYLIIGSEIVIKAIKNIFKGEVFDENFLMTIATIGAFGIEEYPEAVAVMLFYQIGEAFQDYAVDKSKKSINSLMDLRPDYANIKIDEKTEKVNPNSVKIGDKIVIKPGERIPLDGIVIEGTSMIDTSAITGESVPRKAETGDEILSGCINLNGELTVRVIKEYKQSMASKIIELVENADNRKSESENFISKFAKYYTPIVVIIALCIAIIPPLVLIDDFSNWAYRALSFLVVSCPCALVISIPLSFFGGIGGASRKGILIKGSNYLEALSKTKIVVFDKTGTLTKGVFEVKEIHAIEIEKDELLKLVVHAENFSIHPIAKSIKNAYKGEIDPKIITSKQELSGLGIVAKVAGKVILAGNSKLMEQRNIEYTKCEDAGTIIYVAIDGKYVGYILISDIIKEDARNAIEKLKTNGISRIIMLTGDRKEAGEDIAKQLGIDKVYTGLLPNQKQEIVEELLKKKILEGKLVFVGDGINDAPVLVSSDIGIAMGALGSDAAIEAADVVIMTDEPSKLIDAINLSKKTVKIAKQNIIFSIIIKVLILILSAIGVTNMWHAVFADVGVSILAILNAMRMLKGE